MNLKDFIRSIPDYPKKGILFRDITTLIKNEKAFEETINQIVKKAQKFDFNKIQLQYNISFISSFYKIFYKNHLEIDLETKNIQNKLKSNISILINPNYMKFY